MNEFHSDALVFFGASGDLAYKKIFPSLQAMVKRGGLNVPVIGVARSGWTIEQFRARARDSVEKHGGIDPAAFDKLASLLRYVDGDYNSPTIFQDHPQRARGRLKGRHTISPFRLACLGWSWNSSLNRVVTRGRTRHC